MQMLSIVWKPSCVQKRSFRGSLKECKSSFTLRDSLILCLFHWQIKTPKPFISGILSSHAVFEWAVITLWFLFLEPQQLASIHKKNRWEYDYNKLQACS